MIDRLIARACKDPADFEQVRLVRNAVREFMTNHTAEISVEEQINWYETLDLTENCLVRYALDDKPDICIGFGYVRRDAEKRWWLTGGLLPEYREHGLGRQIFEHLTLITDRPCWLEVLKSNMAALTIYRRIGFCETSRDNTKITMVLRKGHQIPLFKVRTSDATTHKLAMVLESGYLGQGKVVDEFESGLRTLFDTDREILAVNSCTSALDLALHMVGVKPGDAVITTAMTCTATNSPIVNRGAIPVWADVNRFHGVIDPNSVSKLLELGCKPKAIVAVDWAGRACDYDELRKVANGIPIIEDAAHALLTRYKGRSITQNCGDYVCWSFQAIKHLTTGDGGAIMVPTDQIDRARLLRWYGLDRRSGDSFRCKQNIQEVGYKYHMNDVAASIGLAGLPLAKSTVEKHTENAHWYYARLDASELTHVGLPRNDSGSSWWLYTILVDNGPSFEKFMAKAGIDVSKVHARNDKHDAFIRASDQLPQFKIPMPGLDYFAEREYAIPVGWWVTADDREYIANKVVEWDRLEY